MFFFFLGLVDLIAGILIAYGLFTDQMVFPALATWIAIILVVKGIFSMFSEIVR